MYSGHNYRGGMRGGFGGKGNRDQYRYEGEYWLEENPEQFRKLFIGGLSYETSTASLKEHFAKWGKVEDGIVMADANKKSRGFGFVTFEDVNSIDEVQKGRPHTVDGRKVETKRAMPRDRTEEPGGQNVTKKIHVKHIPKDMTEDEIRKIFSKEGDVEKVSIPSKNNQKSDFAFVTFADEDTTDKCVIKKMFNVSPGVTLEVNKAIERDQHPDYSLWGMRGGGMRGMRGGGRSYYQNYDNYYGSYDDGYGGGQGYGGGYNGNFNDGYNSGAMRQGGYSQRGQGHYGGGVYHNDDTDYAPQQPYNGSAGRGYGSGGYGRGGFGGGRGDYGGYGRGGRPY